MSPLQTLKTPQLVEDDSETLWSRTAQKMPLKNVKQRIMDVITGPNSYLEDPRVGPILLLGALISLGYIWLRRSQQAHLPEQNQPNQPGSEV